MAVLIIQAGNRKMDFPGKLHLQLKCSFAKQYARTREAHLKNNQIQSSGAGKKTVKPSTGNSEHDARGAASHFAS
jgi:hypothetical protein